MEKIAFFTGFHRQKGGDRRISSINSISSMAMEHPASGDVAFPIENEEFPASHVSFQGGTPSDLAFFRSHQRT